MSLLKKNLVANFVGNGWTALVGAVLVPLYIKFLGIEAWGLMGIYASLQALCALLDFGLKATLNREMARLSIREDNAQEMRDLVRTLELIYWGVAVVIGIVIFALAPLIATHWVQANQLSRETIQDAVRLIGLAVSLQWPFSLYSGGLAGLQRQVLFNGINIIVATLRGLGGILILWKISSTLQAFFLWQAGVSLLQACLAGWFLWDCLPHPRTPMRSSFRSRLLRRTWRFAAGISGITVMSLILAQMDKIILSRLVSLELFGYYVLAGTVATSISLLAAAFFSAFYPRLTQLLSLGDEEGLSELYHHSCQLLSVVILPVAAFIACFSKEILFFWTGNPITAANTHLILTVLVMGTAVNGLLYLPIALQLAYGWTKLIFYMNLLALVFVIPSIVVMASLYGAVGAAFVWVVVNAGLALAVIPLMHRRILKGEQWKWYVEDIGMPLTVAFGTALACVIVMPANASRLLQVTLLGIASLCIMGSTLLATTVTRHALIGYIRSWRARAFVSGD